MVFGDFGFLKGFFGNSDLLLVVLPRVFWGLTGSFTYHVSDYISGKVGSINPRKLLKNLCCKVVPLFI